MGNSVIFRNLAQQDIPLIVSSFTEIGWNKPASIYQKYLAEQENHQRSIWIAFKDGAFIGYITLKWRSNYAPFQADNIPEISDLNVLPKFRNQGFASTLLDLAEAEAFKKSSTVGIAVGLSAEYGAAQRLYVKRGYIPDGKGITYHCHSVLYGSSVVLDDDLVLWFTKRDD